MAHQPHLGSDPCLRILEGLHKVADIIGQLPRGVDVLQHKAFHWKAEISRDPTFPKATNLHGTAP